MPKTLTVKALYDYDGSDSTHLQFQKDEIIVVLKRLESGWWYGQIGNRKGWFPSNYCTQIKQHTVGGLEDVELNFFSTDVDTLGQLTQQGTFYPDTIEPKEEDGIVYTWGGLSVYVIHSIRILVRYMKAPEDTNDKDIRLKCKELMNKVMESVYVMLDSSGMLSPESVKDEIKAEYSQLVLGVAEVVLGCKEYLRQGSLELRMNGIRISSPENGRRPSIPVVDIKSKVDQWERAKAAETASTALTDRLFELMKRVRDFATLCGQLEIPILQPAVPQRGSWSIGDDSDVVEGQVGSLEQHIERIIRMVLVQSQAHKRGEVGQGRLESVGEIKGMLKKMGEMVMDCDKIIGRNEEEECLEYQIARLSLLNGITRVVQVCQFYCNPTEPTSKRVSMISNDTNNSKQHNRMSFISSGKEESDPLWLTNELITSLRTLQKLCSELIYQLKFVMNERESRLSRFISLVPSETIVQQPGLLHVPQEIVEQRRGSEFSNASRLSYLGRTSLQSHPSRHSQSSRLSHMSRQS
jgi:hypothetical protein